MLEHVFVCRYTLSSQSPVTSVAFAPFHPNLIFGGTYSGRVCLWDNRIHKKTPVQQVRVLSFESLRSTGLTGEEEYPSLYVSNN
jgi:WD40 repeat protein